MLNHERLMEGFPTKIRNKKKTSTLTITIQHWNFQQSNQAQKRNKGHPDWKEKKNDVYKRHDHVYRKF